MIGNVDSFDALWRTIASALPLPSFVLSKLLELRHGACHSMPWSKGSLGRAQRRPRTLWRPGMLLSDDVSTPPKNLHSAPLTGVDSAEVN